MIRFKTELVQTVRVETVRVETVRSETVRVETMRVKTVRVEMVISDTFAIFVVLYFGWKSKFHVGCLQAALVIINVV
ncbi:hypothetical protein Hdeb2414_s0146g00813121 [Helianthus debilis subsp. tardiflorus]